MEALMVMVESIYIGWNDVKEGELEEMGGSRVNEEANTIRQTKEKKQLGGVKTLPFILANEVCDKFAATGFHANMITYLTQQLNLPLVKASNILTNFSGAAGFTPLIGALLADSFAGRYWMIIFGSIIYELGMICLTISAVLPQLHPRKCPDEQNCKEASTLHLSVLYISLLLTSIGLGGIRPCLVTFAADQFDMSKSQTESRTWNFFNLYYACLALASVLALTVVVYIQDQVSWGWGLGIPTIIMGLSIVAFVVGSPLYKKIEPGGSPLLRVQQVIVAAIKKRKAIAPADPHMLYENRELDAKISSDGRLLHTNQMRWLDRAAVVAEDEIKENTPNLWRLATVHRVEELKSVIRMLPVWSTTILFVMAYSHQQSFTIVQARNMDRHLTESFEIPPASMAIFNNLAVLISLALYERFFIPFARRFTKNPAGITCLQRMSVGFVTNIVSTIVAALVEAKRKGAADSHNLLDRPTATIPMSVFWLVPQYFLHGIADAFLQVGHLEFLYDQSPESMRSALIALHWISIASGNYLGTLLVSLIHKYSSHRGRNWLPDHNLNKGKLDYYYWLVSGIQVMNFMYYLICAWFYTYKPLEEVTKEGDIEGIGNHTALSKVVNDPNGAIGKEYSFRECKELES